MAAGLMEERDRRTEPALGSIPPNRVGRLRGVGLDALLCALLLIAVILPYRAAVLDPTLFPAGKDLTQHYSREAYNRRAFKTTYVPLWNPYEFSGFPTQADIQTGIFYPPNIILHRVSIAHFITWTVIFHIWIFGVGGYILCRVLGASRFASLAAATGLMLGGIAVPRAYAGHLDVLRTAAWVPMSLAFGIRSIDRQTIWPTAAAVVSLSLAILGSFLQLVVYTFAAIAAYALFTVIWPPTGSRPPKRFRITAIHTALLVAIVLGATALQLLPTARLIAAAGRTRGMTYLEAHEDSLPLAGVARAVFRPPHAETPEVWEMSTYVGWLPAALAPLALFARKQRRAVVFLVLFGGVVLALATGGPLYYLHFLLLPMFRIPGRLLCFLALAIAPLGALGLDRLAALVGRATKIPLAAAAVCILAFGMVWWDVAHYARPFISFRTVEDRFAPGVPFKPTPGGRVLSLCEDRIQTSEISALGIPSVDGYNSYFLQDYARLAELAGRRRLEPLLKAFPRIGTTTETPDITYLNALDVTDILACRALRLPGLQVLEEREGFDLYKNTGAAGRVSVRCGGQPTADGSGPCDAGSNLQILEQDTPSGRLKFRISVNGPRLLALSEPYYPERRAWVDGVETPVEKFNVALSAIQVGPGVHAVELRFVPTSLYAGAFVSVLTLILWGFAATRANRISRAAA